MLFDLLSFLMLITAFFVIVTSNQVHALFCLISVFVQMTIMLLVYYQFEFIPFLIIIVYIGAIAILFLFVVMMLDVNTPFNATNNSFFGFSLFLIFLSYLVSQTLYFDYTHSLVLEGKDPYSSRYSVPVNYYSIPSDQRGWQDILHTDTDLRAISEVLYTAYAVPFILSSFILLVAMLGAISLTLKQKPYVKRQLVVEQNHRNFEKTIRRVSSKRIY